MPKNINAVEKQDTTKKKTTVKKETVAKKTTTAKVKSKTSVTKSAATAKKVSAVNKKTSSSTKKKNSNVVKTAMLDFPEYYDLPCRYNQTTVRILAQTPNMLFVYWDISDEDRLLYKRNFGENFFSQTRPVLIVHNQTMDYTFEVEINDFANSWYLHVNDVDSKYIIELGRRPNLYQDSIKEDYVYITSSNPISAPNDHVLFEKFNKDVTYKDVKTGEVTKKDFSKLSNFKNMNAIYDIYNLYRKIYKNELFDEIVEGNTTNPSSYSSSQFK